MGGKHRKTSALCMQKHGVPSGVHKSIPVTWNRTNLTATLSFSRPQAVQKMSVVVANNFSTMLFGFILFRQPINSIPYMGFPVRTSHILFCSSLQVFRVASADIFFFALLLS